MDRKYTRKISGDCLKSNFNICKCHLINFSSASLQSARKMELSHETTSLVVQGEQSRIVECSDHDNVLAQAQLQ